MPNIQAYTYTGGVISATPILHNLPFCVSGYSTSQITLGITPNLITAVQITNNCTNASIIVKGDLHNITKALEEPCCKVYGFEVGFVDLIDTNTTYNFCVNNAINFTQGLSIDLSPYGGASSVGITSNQSIVDAFKALGIEVKVNGCSLIFPYNTNVQINPIEIKTILPYIANISISQADIEDIGITLTAIGVNPTNVNSAVDKFKISANMNGVAFTSPLINYGDIPALVALNWLSVGLSKIDGTPLDASNFSYTGNNILISNATKNAKVITQHPFYTGEALQFPMPNNNKAFPINISFQHFAQGIIGSNISTDIIQTGKHLEYISFLYTKSDGGTIQSIDPAVYVINNAPLVNDFINNFFTATVDGVLQDLNLINFSHVVYQSASKIEIKNIDPINTVDNTILGSYSYRMPYSNIDLVVSGNDDRRIVPLGRANSNYDYLFINNGAPNEPLYSITRLIWPYDPQDTAHNNYRVSIDGINIPALAVANRPPFSSIYNQNSILNLLAYSENVTHEMRMDVDLVNIDGTTDTLAKFATTQFIIKAR